MIGSYIKLFLLNFYNNTNNFNFYRRHLRRNTYTCYNTLMMQIVFIFITELLKICWHLYYKLRFKFKETDTVNVISYSTIYTTTLAVIQTIY
jgi:hypothetical protein